MITSPDFSVRGKVVLITGAAGGLGSAFAASLAAEGAKVVAVDIDRVGVTSAADTINRGGGQAIGIGCDITNPADVIRVVDHAISSFGRLDALVNNAGINQVASAIEADFEGWCRVIQINLVGPFLMSRTVAPHMIAQGSGSVVNITSIHASVAPAFHPASAYASSKAGLLGLTRALAVEWGRHSVRVNALAPGFARTEMTRGRLDDPDYVARIIDRSPIPNIVEIADLLGALHYLVSDASRMVTGQTLGIDGGWLAV